MEWVRYELGGYTWSGTCAEPGVVFEAHGRERVLASDGVREVSGPVMARFEGPFDPFRWEQRGKKRRLSWPHGSVTVSQASPAVVWPGFAVIAERGVLTIVAAEGDRVARLSVLKIDLGWSLRIAANDDRLWLGAAQSVFAVELRDLEALLDGKNRDVSIEVRSEYPLRRPDGSLDCIFLMRIHSGESMVESRGDRYRYNLDLPELGLQRNSPLRLIDELSPGNWRAVEVSSGTVELDGPVAPVRLAAKSRLTPADHPEGEDRPIVAQASADQRARIDTLIAAIGNEPEVDHHREVLLDLLQEIGDPAAPVFAAVRAGAVVSDARKKAALGPLAPYLVDLEFRAGLPIAATLSRSAPRAPSFLAEALVDYRLGLFTDLRIGLGPHEIYSILITAPRAKALRRVDANHVKTIEALRDANCTHITRIGHLELLKKRNMAKLAAPVFDRVTTFHATIDANLEVASWMTALIADPSKVYSRVRRRLELDEVDGHHDALRRLVLPYASRLPFETVTIGGSVISCDQG